MNTSKLRDGKKRERQECFVCGKHKEITEWHHATPLSQVKENIDSYAGKKIRLVCLCPNCHAIIHKLNNSDVWKLTKEYTSEEFDKFMSIRIPLE